MYKPEQNKSSEIKQAETEIPEQYKNLPSEVVEELLQPQIHADPEKTKAEKQKKEQILKQIRKNEVQREKGKEEHYGQIYNNLPPEKQKDFTDLQSETAKDIGAHLSGVAKIPDLAKEEAFILDKMKEAYQLAKQKNPDQPVQIQLSQPIDQAVYKNLVRRLSWEKLKNNISQEEDNKLASIKEQIQTGKESEPLNQKQIEDIKMQAVNYRKQEGNDVNNDLMLNPIDGEVGRNFDAHGLAKVNEFVQFDQLLELLGKGIDPNKEFFTAPLALRPEDPKDTNTAGGKALNTGSFIVLGEHGKSIKQGGIKYILVNDMYYHAIPELAKAYPNVEFIRADQANSRLKEIIAGKPAETQNIEKKETQLNPSPDLLKNSRYFIMGWSTFGGRTFEGDNEYKNFSSEFLSALDKVKNDLTPTKEELKKIAEAYIALRDWVFQHGGEEEFKKVGSFKHVEKALNIS